MLCDEADISVVHYTTHCIDFGPNSPWDIDISSIFYGAFRPLFYAAVHAQSIGPGYTNLDYYEFK